MVPGSLVLSPFETRGSLYRGPVNGCSPGRVSGDSPPIGDFYTPLVSQTVQNRPDKSARLATGCSRARTLAHGVRA